jgi:hypothetical protein
MRAGHHSYGNEGFQIMSVTLTLLFPDHSLDLEHYKPVSWDALIHEVLLPEVTIALIREDLGLDRESAIKTMRKSQKFGSIFHPEDDDSPHIKRVRHIVKRLKQASRLIAVKKETVEDVIHAEPVGEHLWKETFFDGQTVIELLD